MSEAFIGLVTFFLFIAFITPSRKAKTKWRPFLTLGAFFFFFEAAILLFESRFYFLFRPLERGAKRDDVWQLNAILTARGTVGNWRGRFHFLCVLLGGLRHWLD